ncbi:MAG: hypothetical protein J0H07_29675 [Sphingobacteriales bacterium]|nr:hypothetical protein [Sphingobacteriales bacterium]
MISSKLVLDILDLLLDGDEYGKSLRPQVNYLTDAKYDYTGAGLFVTFQTSDGIEKYKRLEDGMRLDGISVASSALGVGAMAQVFVSKGIIDYLEIWSYDGEYPNRELNDYILKQEGSFGTGREIKSPEQGPITK